ncbi:hypothetical protein GCM10010174_45680 [Kutzneria viridogrisea]|uniref:Uncharacterized protein n=1 Tax=Kutzneria viridogrisea TaxID=47990 RepID=A0ABR6BTG1_9PSEU|nr:hypothetical protein [Kutzneria viridogrisea]
MTDNAHTPMAALATWASDGQGGLVQGTLKVQPDQLLTVKAVWEQARDKFREMKLTASELQTIPYSGNDEVSKQAVNKLRKATGFDAGCLDKTLDDCIARCDDLIRQTEQTMKLYHVADTSAAIKLKP